MIHRSNKTLRSSVGLWTAATLIFGAFSFSSGAISRAQADSAYNAWWAKFFNASNNTFYKTDTRTGRIDFWRFAHDWEIMQDRYKLAPTPALAQQMKDVWNGFNNTNGMRTDWKQNDFNDDIEWWIISATRAYLITGDTTYSNTAKRNWDWLFSTQWDMTLDGGIWWKNTEKGSKNACSNGPGTASAMNLYLIFKDPAYLDQAKRIYAWEKLKLFNATSGAVSDNINASGRVGGGALYYNQGTFFGPAIQLWQATGDIAYYNDAIKAMDYVKNNMSNRTTTILNNGGTTGDGCTFMLIAIHYMFDGILVYPELKSKYLPWMTVNAEAAWNNRRRSDNIMSSNFGSPAPASLESSSASGGVAAVTLAHLAGSTVGIFEDKKKSLSLKAFDKSNGAIFSVDGKNLINFGKTNSTLLLQRTPKGETVKMISLP